MDEERFRSLRPVDRGAVTGVGVVAIAAFLVVVFIAAGGQDRPGANGWIYEYQNLVAGILAVLAAGGTIWYLRRQAMMMAAPFLAAEADTLSDEHDTALSITSALTFLLMNLEAADPNNEDDPELLEAMSADSRFRHWTTLVARFQLGPTSAALRGARNLVHLSLRRLTSALFRLRMHQDTPAQIGACRDAANDCSEAAKAWSTAVGTEIHDRRERSRLPP